MYGSILVRNIAWMIWYRVLGGGVLGGGGHDPSYELGDATRV